MNTIRLKTDYFIAGAGAVGMAFADIMLTETEASMILVDRHDKPGGHWNDAYPFVTLHQPSQFYGVSSTELSSGKLDQVGWNKGLNDLASGAQVSAYFDDVMRHQFLPSGRVQYFPMCDYIGDNAFVSRLSGQRYEVEVSEKFVDATYLNTSVPSTHTPNFSVADDVQFVPLNDLPKVSSPPAGFVLIGGGKTSIDACLWLLQHHVDPDRITWIMPRDAWLLNRRNTQPTDEFFADSIGAQAAQMESIAQAESVADMFARLEACGYFLRIDSDVEPQMFHGATVSEMELEQLRRVRNIVRGRRVVRLEADRIVFDDESSFATSQDHMHVDCSARAIENLDIKPIFQGDTITPQAVRSYQPVFSAAFVAHVEACYDDEAKKNELCGVVPLPNTCHDYLIFTSAFLLNQFRWSQEPAIGQWLMGNRLDGFSQMVRKVSPDDSEKVEILHRLRSNVPAAMKKLHEFMAQHPIQTEQS